VLWLLRRIRRGTYRGLPYGYWIAVASVGIPVLLLPVFEYTHPFLAGAAGIGVWPPRAYAAGRPGPGRGVVLPELWPRVAWAAVIGAFVLFTSVMGFLAHRRMAAFYAHPYDFSWEMNAIAGILRHGYPTISMAADSYYLGKHQPAPYWNL